MNLNKQSLISAESAAVLAAGVSIGVGIEKFSGASRDTDCTTGSAPFALTLCRLIVFVLIEPLLRLKSARANVWGRLLGASPRF